MKKNEIQRRTAVCQPTQYRAVENGDGLFIEGYFAVFSRNYEITEGVTESIAPGAFAGALDADIRALTNHDTTLVLGRTRAGTLELREDETGLWGRIAINREDRDAVNLYERVRRGDVDQCSFGFRIAEDRPDFKPDGSVHWTILKVDPLYEVSVVTFPAYKDTSVAARMADTDAAKQRRLEGWRAEMTKKLKGDK